MNDGRFTRIHSINDQFLDQIGNEQAWFLGLMAADGNVRQGGRYITIGQSKDTGKKLIEVVAKMIGFGGPVYTQKNNHHQICFTSERLSIKLSEYGIVPNKSLVYRFPESLPVQHYAAFLRGYIDGDGSVGIYSQPRKQRLCHWLLISFVGTPEFVNRCDEIIPIKGNIRRIERATNLSEFRLTGRKAVELGKWLWADDSLPVYKQSAFDEFVSTHLNERNYTFYESAKVNALIMLAQGMRPEEIALKVGVTWQTIYNWKAQMQPRIEQGDV
jgi:hypothetical protein